jgi:hypothetical protein
MTEEIGIGFNKLINEHVNEDSIESYKKIRTIYNDPYFIPELDTVKRQICECIVFGLYIAGMTIINHLLERCIKVFLIYSDVLLNKRKGEHSNFEINEAIKLANAKYDSELLGKNIESALSKKMITNDEFLILNEMRKNFRNAYAHCDRKLMYGEQSESVTEIFGKEQFVDFIKGDESKLPKRNESLDNLLMFDFIWVNNQAKKDCIPYIKSLDKIIRDVEKRLFPNYKSKIQLI